MVFHPLLPQAPSFFVSCCSPRRVRGSTGVHGAVSVPWAHPSVVWLVGACAGAICRPQRWIWCLSHSTVNKWSRSWPTHTTTLSARKSPRSVWTVPSAMSFTAVPQLNSTPCASSHDAGSASTAHGSTRMSAVSRETASVPRLPLSSARMIVSAELRATV